MADGVESLSPADLGAALAALEEISAKDEHIAGVISRLEAAMASNNAIAAELAALAALEAEDALAWAGNPGGPALSLRTPERADLDARAADARAKVAAAQRALEMAQEQRRELGANRRATVARIEAGAVDWLDGEVEPLIAELEGAAAKVLDLRSKIEGARTLAISIGTVLYGKSAAGPDFLRLAEQFKARAPNLPLRVPEDAEVMVSWQEWRRHLSTATAGIVGEAM